MCGRGSRTTDKLNSFNILDFGNNIKRLGHWENPRDWSLKKKLTREQPAPVKDCPKCKAILLASTKVCPYCEHKFINKKEAEIARLELIKNEVIKNYSEMSNA